ncbi:esterase/lipase family protein [Streptomyces ziwulingensis]|uniref:GPI inositol-deacylase PGAP1-like alpha/beta domain-containing protein n=1 Tax=Streptomyces ziwulingensis TaxID=1045501 RepID=A0ABP9C3H6_9ACTN
MIRRWSAFLAAAIAALVLGTAAVPAQAAPARDDSNTEAVYFVKGYSKGSPPGANCKTYWKPATAAFTQWGWQGKLHTVGFYTRDRGCSVTIARRGTDASLRSLGRALAKDIYRRYTSKGKSVDLVGHSMGGLIVRAALTGVQQKLPGWPTKLYVEDVVTLGTPHDGLSTLAGIGCSLAYGTRQCQDMRHESSFLDWAAQSPQGTQGTDWTLIGAADDDVVDDSALRMSASHDVWYPGSNGWSHGALTDITTGTYAMNYRNWPTPPLETQNGAAPIRAAMNALYWEKDW